MFRPNAEETEFTIVGRLENVLGKKEKHAVGVLTSAEKEKTITVLAAVNAVGHYIPPMFIFPRKRMKPELLEKVPEGSIGGANPTVWINSELFETWFDDFTTCVQPKSRTRPTLLVLDGQKSRTKSASLIDKARENNVIILSPQPHTTHKMQPLDRSFFKSLKSYYTEEVPRWL